MTSVDFIWRLKLCGFAICHSSLGRSQFGHEHTREVSPEGRIPHTDLSQITYRNREVCLFP